MKRRIVVAIVLVAGLAVVAFGAPLGVVIDRQYEGEALLRLERSAILAERDIPAGWRPGQPLTIDQPSGDTTFGVYDPAGDLVFGDGPATGDEPVRVALADGIGEAESDQRYVIVVPVTEGGTVIAALRAEQHLGVTDRRIRVAWASMGLLALAVVGGAILLARWLANRIAVPVEALQANAAQLGTDGFVVTMPRSGMAELDDVARALEDAAQRVAESVERERAFSAEVSHQLRTPITGLRLLVETERVAPRADPARLLDEAAAVVARLEETVEELLLLARNRPTDRGAIDLSDVLAELDGRWQPRFRDAGRTLVVTGDPVDSTGTVVASRSALGHILDVLVDNALRHGQGTVTITSETVDGGIAVRAADEGSLGGADGDGRRAGTSPSRGPDRNGRPGIGLGLAERLARAEGGDLVCSSRSPTVFSVLLPTV